MPIYIGMDALEILKKQKKPDVSMESFDMNDFVWFSPSMEFYGEAENKILPDVPIKLLLEGKLTNKVPLIIGTMDMDGLDFFTGSK